MRFWWRWLAIPLDAPNGPEMSLNRFCGESLTQHAGAAKNPSNTGSNQPKRPYTDGVRVMRSPSLQPAPLRLGGNRRLPTRDAVTAGGRRESHLLKMPGLNRLAVSSGEEVCRHFVACGAFHQRRLRPLSARLGAAVLRKSLSFHSRGIAEESHPARG